MSAVKKYANNHLRKFLSEEEKKRFNAYKKRECERKRRYRAAGKLYHPCFWKYRCESCKDFFKNLHMFKGYNLCFRCIKEDCMSSEFFLDLFIAFRNEVNVLKARIASEGIEEEEEEEQLCSIDLPQFLTDGEIEEMAFDMRRAFLEDQFRQLYPEMDPKTPADIDEEYASFFNNTLHNNQNKSVE